MVVTREPEILFEEARRRTRRRRLISVGCAALVVGTAAASTLLLTAGGHARHAAGAANAGLVSSGGDLVRLKAPDALAVSPDGTLYVVDPKRDQILRLLPSGKFAVIAGSGKPGFSGDGGPATHARLRLDSNSTITVARDDTVYLADSENNRVRAIAPNGRISTIVRVKSPAGLAIGPHDQLYIGATALFRLPLTGGRLQRLAGWRDWKPPVSHQEILEGYFSPTQGLAVDSSGDVYAVSFPGVFERTAGGKLRCLGSFRAGGQPAQLAESPSGAIYGAAFSIFRLGSRALNAHGPCDGGTPVLDERGTQLKVNRKIDNALGNTFGWRNLERQKQPMLGPANGLAVAANGTIYYDSDFGYWATPALVEVTRDGRARVLWRARS
jgi:hypothetical protein